MDPRDIMDSYHIHEKRAKEQYSYVLSLLKELKDKGTTHTSSITDLYNEYNIIEDDLE